MKGPAEFRQTNMGDVAGIQMQENSQQILGTKAEMLAYIGLNPILLLERMCARARNTAPPLQNVMYVAFKT